MKQTKIPIKNIFYMLSYSWRELPPTDFVTVESEEFEGAASFFLNILYSQFESIRRSGLFTAYIEVTSEDRSIKGKINFNESIKKLLFENAKASCTYDELTADCKLNQLLKWAFKALIATDGLQRSERHKAHEALEYLRRISDIQVSKRDFAAVRFHNGNKNYKYAIYMCELLYDNVFPDEQNIGSVLINDFFKDEKIMARIFEEFVRNFYALEPNPFNSAKSEILNWNVKSAGGDLDYLPQMKTDITLYSKDAVKIVDTKFYPEIFSTRYEGQEKFKSNNLYQIMAYLNSYRCKPGQSVSGMLLYPANGFNVYEKYLIDDKEVVLASIDLSMKWELLRSKLLELVS